MKAKIGFSEEFWAEHRNRPDVIGLIVIEGKKKLRQDELARPDLPPYPSELILEWVPSEDEVT